MVFPLTRLPIYWGGKREIKRIRPIRKCNYLVVSRKRHRRFSEDGAVLIKDERDFRIRAQRVNFTLYRKSRLLAPVILTAGILDGLR